MLSDGTYCDPLFMVAESDGEDYCIHTLCENFEVIEGTAICDECADGYEVEYETKRCIIECPTKHSPSIDGLYCIYYLNEN